MSFHPLFHQDHQNLLQALIHTYMCKEAQESTIDGVAFCLWEFFIALAQASPRVLHKQWTVLQESASIDNERVTNNMQLN